jgi:transglutaminase-like putative cysteine protease
MESVAGDNRASTGDWRRLDVVYLSKYGYSKDVPESEHLFRLRPLHDYQQEVVKHQLRVTPVGSATEFYDVFDNHAVAVKIRNAYRDLVIEARSSVRVRTTFPDRVREERSSGRFPIIWMPWQRQQLVPFLLPPELPDSELEVLSRYGMTVADKHNGDVFATMIGLNEDIHDRIRYVAGSTTLHTTPFQVFQNRQGVCQDYANLLICVARLLDIPARYRTGYVYNPGSSESQSFHAWAELYLPWYGWKGFDPTSGKFASHDHVRVAVGRNYRDAAPVTGTIRGDAKETYEVSVEVTKPEGA